MIVDYKLFIIKENNKMAIYQIIIVLLPSSKSYRYISEQKNYELNRTQLFKKSDRRIVHLFYFLGHSGGLFAAVYHFLSMIFWWLFGLWSFCFWFFFIYNGRFIINNHFSLQINLLQKYLFSATNGFETPF